MVGQHGCLLTGCSVDVKLLDLYQQLYIYFIPILTNLCFINIIVVVVRLFWFKKHLAKVGKCLVILRGRRPWLTLCSAEPSQQR